MPVVVLTVAHVSPGRVRKKAVQLGTMPGWVGLGVAMPPTVPVLPVGLLGVGVVEGVVVGLGRLRKSSEKTQ